MKMSNRKITKLVPRQRSAPGTLIQVGTECYTFGVEIYIDDDSAVSGKRIYTWAMAVYRDEQGEFIDFSKTQLNGLLGKIYLNDLDIMEV